MSLYFTPKVHSTNLVDIPSNPHTIIQKVAPAPPNETATATPAIFPRPTVPDTAVANAWKCVTCPGALGSSYFPLAKSMACLNPLILIKPILIVKNNAPNTNQITINEMGLESGSPLGCVKTIGLS